MIKQCVDCKAPFKDPHNQFNYCVICRDRRQEYKEDGEREERGYDNE